MPASRSPVPSAKRNRTSSPSKGGVEAVRTNSCRSVRFLVAPMQRNYNARSVPAGERAADDSMPIHLRRQSGVTAPLPRHSAAQAWVLARALASSAPGRFALAVGLLLTAGVTEAFGLLMIVPLLQVAGLVDTAGEPGLRCGGRGGSRLLAWRAAQPARRTRRVPRSGRRARRGGLASERAGDAAAPGVHGPGPQGALRRDRRGIVGAICLAGAGRTSSMS